MSRTTRTRNAGFRYNAAESPLSALSRRKDKDGKPFLSPDLVAAGERLREDFELAQMGPRVTQNWERFLSGGARGDFSGGETGGSTEARDRVGRRAEGPGPRAWRRGAAVLLFSGRNGIGREPHGLVGPVGKDRSLRIALLRLKTHYDEKSGNWSPLIG